jgi:hypothetical protein
MLNGQNKRTVLGDGPFCVTDVTQVTEKSLDAVKNSLPDALRIMPIMPKSG